jgi:membrane-anchored protein YejM (alkaline phosphatase superfamily)
MFSSYEPSTRNLLLRWCGWLLLSTIAFELVIAARYFGVTDFDQGPGSLAFRAAMLLAHFTVLSTVLLAVVLVLALLRAPVWLVASLGTVLSIATLFALLIDTQVYQLYRFHIDAGVMNLLLGGAAQETFDFSGSMYFSAAAIAAAIILVQSVAAWLAWRYVLHNPGSRRVARTLTAVLLGIVVTFHVVHIWADATDNEPLLEQTQVLPLKYAATAKRSLRALGFHVRSQPVALRSDGQDRGDLVYPLYPLKCEQSGTPPNIIVILIDSWRRDALNAQVTPNIHQFARSAVRFMDHHSGGNATRIGVFSLFYAIPGTYWHRMLAERQGPVFITQLLERGYDVRAFRSAPLFSPEFDRTVFAQVDGPRMRSDGKDSAERDRDLTSDFLSFLESRSDDGPFFSLLFYDSPHKLGLPPGYRQVFRPSAPDVNYLGLHAVTDPLPLLNRYRNSTHYVDSLIGEVLAAIKERGLLEKSVIVITGDHGQEFNDNRRNYWGHNSNFTRFQTGVPLLLYSPTLRSGSYSHRTTHFDVVPTLMREYLDCDMPFSTYSVGQSLFEPGGRETLVMSEYSDFAIVTPDKIAVIRKQGMQVLDTRYGPTEGRLDRATVEAALEQKSRFYRRAGNSSK